jgi:hypothetical protein
MSDVDTKIISLKIEAPEALVKQTEEFTKQSNL